MDGLPDLNKVFACPTRLEVLIAFSGPRRSAGAVTKLLSIGRTLASMHLRTLTRQGLLEVSREPPQPSASALSIFIPRTQHPSS